MPRGRARGRRRVSASNQNGLGSDSPMLRLFVGACLVAALAHAVPSSAKETNRGAKAAKKKDHDANRKVASASFEAGSKAFRNGEYDVAARAFEVAYRLGRHPIALYNAAIAWEKDGQLPAAADDLFLSLQPVEGDDTLSDKQASDAGQRLDQLRKKLGWIEVEAPEGAVLRVDDAREERGAPTVFHFAPGEASVAVTFADGNTDRATVDVVAGESLPVAFIPPSPEPTPVVVDIEPADDGLLIGGVICLSLGVAAAGTAIGVGLAATSARDDFLDDRSNADLRQRAADFRLGANIATGVAGVAGAAGLTLIVLHVTRSDPAADTKEREKEGLRLRVSPTELRLFGTF